MANHKYFPEEIKNPKIEHMEAIFYRSRGGILVCMWKDKKARKPVIAVSTKGEIANRRGTIMTEPCIVNEYNNSMNGCDLMDQIISYDNIFNQKTI